MAISRDGRTYLGTTQMPADQMPQKVKAIAMPARREPIDRFVENIRNYVVVTAWVNLLVGITDTILLLVMGVLLDLLAGFQGVPAVLEIHVNDVAEFVLGIIGYAYGGPLAFHPHPGVFSMIFYILRVHVPPPRS